MDHSDESIGPSNDVSGMAGVEHVAQAAQQDVWDVLADGWLYPLWVVGASRIRTVDDTWPSKGSLLHHSFGLWPALVHDTTEVLDVDPRSYIMLRARGWPFGEAHVELHLSRVGPAQTRIRLFEKVVEGPGRLIPTTVEVPLLKWRNRESLTRLALLAEGRAARPGSAPTTDSGHQSTTRSEQ